METGIAALDTSIHKTNVWLKELLWELEWTSRARAWSGLRAVLHALRDRLTFEEAFDLAAELPLIVRGMYTEGWDRRRRPMKLRSKEEFLTLVAENLVRAPDVDPEPLTRAVFGLLARHLDSGEIGQVRSMLPDPVRRLWPAAPARPSERPSFERGGNGEGQRTALRQAKREIHHAIAKARARGVRAQDLPLLESRPKRAPGRARRRTIRGEK
jgi:uncharacterized protein (DUF2267 family)